MHLKEQFPTLGKLLLPRLRKILFHRPLATPRRQHQSSQRPVVEQINTRGQEIPYRVAHAPLMEREVRQISLDLTSPRGPVPGTALDGASARVQLRKQPLPKLVMQEVLPQFGNVHFQEHTSVFAASQPMYGRTAQLA